METILTTRNRRWLVETDWLAERHSAPDVVVLDASMHLPITGRNAKAEFAAEHVPSAIFFDIDDIADKKSKLPHMLPSPVEFSSRMRKMGIGDGMRIVCYDSLGLYSAARAWWMFRIMGHEDVVVLNGGLKKWKAEGRPLESGPPAARTPRHFTARFNASLVRDRDDVKSLIGHSRAQIVDARAKERWLGTVAEPRQGLRSGHIPTSRSLHFQRLVNADGTLKSIEALQRKFLLSGVDVNRPVVASCGSGVTACVIALALAELGRPDAAIYDGSWSEWGADPSLPIETDPAL
ncbi:MAG: 3-mercaptopyruvate sulfurtransferase [Hyphomicrobiaceae bacterium]|nr:MAG: 3-mercaptopyruvate sulfurtransferase [Hyphomicrobiaceae bacterium]